MRKFFLIISLLLIPNLSYAHQCNEKLDNLSKQYDIPIICKSSSVEDGKRFIYKNPELGLIERSTPSIYRFLNSYDKEFLKKHLKRIYLFENLKYLNVDVGGLSDGNDIWVCLDNYTSPLEEVYARIIHHEFSSNIYKSVPFYKRLSWKNLGVGYDTSMEFLKKCLQNHSFAIQVTEYLLQNGFLKNYSRTNDENDFNVYAETLYSSPFTLKALSKKYHLIKIKLQKVKEFYKDAGLRGTFPDET